MSLTFTQVATQKEIETTAGLAKEIWQQHYTPIIGSEQVEYMLDKFQSVSAITDAVKDGYIYHLISKGENYAGYFGTITENNKMFLSKLYIKSAYRGKGIASSVLTFLVRECENNGVDKIWLTCNKHNENTLKAYKGLGFEIVDSQQADVGQGYIMDDYILEKKI